MRSFFKIFRLGLAGFLLYASISSAGERRIDKNLVGTVKVSAAEVTYYAMEHDTLSSISQKFTDTTRHWEAIGKHNQIRNDRAIPIGFPVLIPTELLAEDPSQAQVLALAGSVTETKKSGQNTDLVIGSIVSEGSQLQTGKNGFITLSLPDNSRVSIPSNSLVILNKLKKTRYTNSPRTEIKLMQGRVESLVSPLEANKGRYEVRSPLAIAGVRGTHFRVAVNDDEIGNEVLSGGVAVGQTAHPNALILPAGQGNIITAKGVGQPQPLLPAPQLETEMSVLDKASLEFTIRAQENAQQYHAQIAKDSSAQNLIAETYTQEQTFKFKDIADGAYFLRLTAIDAHHLEGLPSITPIQVKAHPEPPFPLQPKHKVRATSVRFVWTQMQSAQAYQLQVARDAKFTDMVIDQSQIHAAEWQTDALTLGHYFWRVASLVEKDAGLDRGPYCATQSFDLLAMQGESEIINGQEMLFRWRGETGQSFLVQIASDPEFQQLILSQTTAKAELAIPRPAPGKYYLRVRATDADRFVGSFSAVQQFETEVRWTTSDGTPLHSESGDVRLGKTNNK